jgi:N6-adenosine-specific RNA methylase IME4
VTTHADLPPHRYALILADPAWETVLWSGAKRTPTQKAGADHYPVMSAQDMAALPIAQIAADDAVMAMWAIDSHMDQALQLGRDWGFTYATVIFYWAKQRRLFPDQIDLFTDDVAPAPIGMGKYTRKQVEPCLLFKRGKGVKVRDHSVRQLIVAPKREHSRKPDEQYDRLTALFGDVPRIELFARTTRPGWAAWGNETDKFPAAESMGAA